MDILGKLHIFAMFPAFSTPLSVPSGNLKYQKVDQADQRLPIFAQFSKPKKCTTFVLSTLAQNFMSNFNLDPQPSMFAQFLGIFKFLLFAFNQGVLCLWTFRSVFFRPFSQLTQAKSTGELSGSTNFETHPSSITKNI